MGRARLVREGFLEEEAGFKGGFIPMASERLRGLGEVPGCSEPQLPHLQCEDHDPGGRGGGSDPDRFT